MDNHASAEQPLQTKPEKMEKMKPDKTVEPVSTFRRLLPQILASGAKNLLILDLAMAMTFPTIAIPALTRSDPDVNEPVRFTDFQASWFASIAFICQPIGSVMSGVILEQLGRKRTMLLVNIPHIIAWLVLYNAQSLQAMFTADILLGMGVGFMEAPVLTYVGEIAEPSVRGVLTAIAGCSFALGCALIYTLGSIFYWREAALVCCGIPVFTMLCISMVPETPLWLLSKGRRKHARKALQWLRGWVSYEHVREEFEQIEHYVEHTNLTVGDEHIPTFMDKVKELVRFNTRRPFFIIMVSFFLANFTAATSMRAYFIQIFELYNMVIDPSTMIILIGVMGFLATVACSAGMKLLGKRKITLLSISSMAVFLFCLAVYTWRMLPPGQNSFSKDLVKPNFKSVTPVVIFLGLAFCTNVGVTSIPWVMISEIFPNKTRGMASGIVAACAYVLSFLSTKCYYELETTLSLFGVIVLYTVFALVGTVFVYKCLPETEGRTLEEIEEHYSNKNNKLTDHHIVAQKLLKKRNSGEC